MFCARECSRLPLYAIGVASRCRWLVEPSSQRGRQRRDVVGQTFQERRDQFHTLRLGEYLDPFNAAARSFLTQAQSRFLQQTADPVASQQLAWQQLENVRQQQASSLAYFDVFWMIAVLTFAVAFLVLFMKRSVAEKRGSIAVE